MTTHCPICDHPATHEYCRKQAHGGEWIIRRCSGCGHGFVANRPTMDQLRDIYAGETHHPLGEFSPRAWSKKRDGAHIARRIAKSTSQRGAALDVGSGDGGFAWHIQQLGFHPLLLIDLDPRAAEAATHIEDAVFRLCAFEDVTTDDGPFATIIMSQILEHALDPLDWLRRSRKLLDEGGVLAIALPNFGGIYRLLGERDPMLIPPVHLNYFSPASLRLALEAAGFSVLRMESSSRVRTEAADQPLSTKRIWLGRSWNILTRPLNVTTRGIVLNAYATPSRAPAASL